MASVQTIENRAKTLSERMQTALKNTDDLYECLKPDAIFERGIAERHRLIFYYGHLEAFDWNLIPRYGFNIKPFNKEWDDLFAFGIDPVDGDLPSDPPEAWPAKSNIAEYKNRVRATVRQCLDEAHLAGNSEHEKLFHVAIEHRLMHSETLAYIFHRIPHHMKTMPHDPAPPQNPPANRRMLSIPAGKATLGMNRREGAFGWDNEFQETIVEVPRFSIASHNVTNGEFLEFLNSGGYRDRKLWSEEGWAWKNEHGIHKPVYWVSRDDGWYQNGMSHELKLPLEWPVFVSHAEARAFAKWKKLELPTEPEFHRAAYGTPEGAEQAYPWGDEAPRPEHGNFDFQRWDPVEVGSYPAGDSAFGVTDLIGNGWEWTSTEFAPLDGFEAFPFYPGYSADFYDSRHYVMKGASPRTAACMTRRSFRNWFQGQYQYPYATMRLVRR